MQKTGIDVSKRKNESKMKPFLANLLEMKSKERSLGIMQSYLKMNGVIISSTATISRYLQKNIVKQEISGVPSNHVLESENIEYLYDQWIGLLRLKCYIKDEKLNIYFKYKPSFFPIKEHTVVIPLANIRQL